MSPFVQIRLTGISWVATVLLLAASEWAAADEIYVAAASNFSGAIQAMARRFEEQTGHRTTLVFGATGKHYAQIRNGAPFDAFFAADIVRPKRLEEEGVAKAGSRFTYGLGKLVLWSPTEGLVDPDGRVLEEDNLGRLAIANPKLAPYGRAAQEVLESRGLWQAFKDRMVRGENIAQTFQFVASGNAKLGFVAWSQLTGPGKVPAGSWWEVPQALYSPIAQQAVLISENPAAREFMSFARGEAARDIIRAYGYGTP